MKFEIELPAELGNEQDGWFEPTGEYRSPRKGELFILDDSHIAEAASDLDGAKIIVRKCDEWPTWLGGWGFAMDGNKVVYWYSVEPVMKDGFWDCGSTCIDVADLLLFDPRLAAVIPKITDWKKPVKNPRFKG